MSVRSVARRTRRLPQTISAFDNGVQVVAQLASGALTGKPAKLRFVLRDGLEITCPNVPGARVPVYEVFAEDAYRIAWFTGDLAAPALLDIGGHIGCFSTAFSRVHPDGRVHTFEASPTTYGFLQGNVADNGLGDRVTVANVAVSDHDGVLQFADNGAGSGLNGLTAPAGSTTVEVPCVRFETALERAGGAVDVVKIDTEGAEYDIVLASSEESWGGVRRVVLEYHPVTGRSWQELRDFFDRAGLQVVRHEPVDAQLGTAWLSRDPLPA